MSRSWLSKLPKGLLTEYVFNAFTWEDALCTCIHAYRIYLMLSCQFNKIIFKVTVNKIKKNDFLPSSSLKVLT